MKNYYKQCKDTKQVNSFLRTLNLDEFQFDADYDFSKANADFDFDSWIDDKETKGISIQVHSNCECFINKYTRADITKMDTEVA